MLKSSLCDYSDAYILVKGTITVVGVGAAAGPRQSGRNDKQVIIKNCIPFTDCISEISNTQLDNAKDLVVVMPMYDLIEYSDSHSKTSGSLHQFCRDEPPLNNAFIAESESFKFKPRLLNSINNASIVNVEIAVPLKYLNNLWKTLEISLINCGINLILTWSASRLISEVDRSTTFAITDTKLYDPVVTLSTQDNAKLLQELK